MNKLLIISGPTATGKTKLALHLAKLFVGELISADSRQVYKQMDIGTGKDWGTENSIHIWGYNVVAPDEEWSSAHFVAFANRLIPKIQQRGKLPIIVGGTGLYIKNLLEPPKTLFISPDKKLRQQIKRLNLAQLQNKLRRLNSQRFSDMNESDRQNPRRLIRAIETSNFVNVIPAKAGTYINRFRVTPGMTLTVALTAPLKDIDRRIENRVVARLKQGLETEVKTLVEKYGWNDILSATIAYQEWRPYFENQIPLEKVIETWTTHEKQYARNQLAWFKKQKNIRWFDITIPGFPDNIVSLVKQWYYR
jgi:tRNA dimethylallyltransferase